MTHLFSTPDHDQFQCRLFIDSSKRSVKGVLLNNGNVLPSIPVADSVIFKESYENPDFLLSTIKYQEFKWQICGDFKILSLLLGQQGSYAKMPCFLSEWNSRAK